MKVFLTASAAVAALSCAVAQAGEVYKYRMPDGRILYTTQVSTTGKLLEVLPEPAPRRRVIEAERQAKLAREREEGLDRVSQRLATLDAVDAEIKLATKALADATAAADAGAEPLPGERRGTAGGKSRLTQEYWERQRRLRLVLDTARQRLDAAYRARDATR